MKHHFFGRGTGFPEGNWMRGKSPLGKEWCVYCKEEELWKTETALAENEEQQKMRAFYMAERDTLNEKAQGFPWTWGTEFSTGTPGKIDSGE